jgi:hypothetical protein
MPTITLSQPWKYCTPLMTIDFLAGTHEVSEEIYQAAPVQPVEETADGDRTATPRAPRRAGKAEG